ncbi:hypothetical protein FRC08_006822 [Ceratobasidium sp. 394]|nr:hypothetical protein FRC08_006822 [Ceratobasidium sp. 394]
MTLLVSDPTQEHSQPQLPQGVPGLLPAREDIVESLLSPLYGARTTSSPASQDSSSLDSYLDLGLSYSLPPRLIPSPSISGITVRFIISQYEPLYKLVFFDLTCHGLGFHLSRLIRQILASDITHWSAYLGARILRLLLRDGSYANLGSYLPWLDRLDCICASSSNDKTLDDLNHRLCGGLELVYFKYVTSNTASGYALLRRLAPTFMQIAFADPTLWPRQPTSSGISLAHTLVSAQLELSRFVFTDALLSLVFGVPPSVEYDTSHPPIQTHKVHPTEWVHGCAVELAIAIVKINVWRAQNAADGTASDPPWNEIEAVVRAWHPRGDREPHNNSWKLIAKLAVREGWRHAVLIYLYMGMCGATSHDARVQHSVRQIGQLLTVMQSDIIFEAHLFIPLLLAAICSRSETQRECFRGAILRSLTNKGWVLDGVQFTYVLDHLWHGAACNGAAVTWDDYLHASNAVYAIST